MDGTRYTLLERAGLGQPDAWDDLVQLYRPFIYRWFHSHGLDHDADDLTQDVLTALLREIPTFKHSGQTGAFRNWLRTTCLNRLRNHWRKVARPGQAVGGTEFLMGLANVEDANAQLEADWNREHSREILRRLFEKLTDEFDGKTLTAFREIVFSERPSADVAQALGMSVAAVYVAKSRVLRRLREEAQELIDHEALEKDGSTDGNE